METHTHIVNLVSCPSQLVAGEIWLLVFVFSHSDFSAHYSAYRRAVGLLATLDCLLSLAKVAKMPGYVW